MIADRLSTGCSFALSVAAASLSSGVSSIGIGSVGVPFSKTSFLVMGVVASVVGSSCFASPMVSCGLDFAAGPIGLSIVIVGSE